MHPIPSNPNLSGIIGSPLVQICFGEYDLQFHFDSNAWIGSQATVLHFESEIQIGSWAEGRLTGPAFLSLLGKAPTRFAVPDPAKLELHFDNGQILALLNNSDQFESFQIYLNGDTMPSLVV